MSPCSPRTSRGTGHGYSPAAGDKTKLLNHAASRVIQHRELWGSLTGIHPTPREVRWGDGSTRTASRAPVTRVSLQTEPSLSAGTAAPLDHIDGL